MAALPQRLRVLGAYRSLLLTLRTVFNGDAAALSQTRAKAREAFVANAGERDAAKIDQLLADAAEAAEFLRAHVVQAALNDAGRYEMKLDASHAEGGAPDAKIQVQPAGAAAAGAVPGGATDGGCCGGGCR